MTTEKDYENKEVGVDAEIHERLSNVVTLLARLAATRHLETRIEKSKKSKSGQRRT